MGEKYGIIQKSGSSYNYGETKIGRGYDSARLFLSENKKVKDEILKEIKKKNVCGVGPYYLATLPNLKKPIFFRESLMSQMIESRATGSRSHVATSVLEKAETVKS